MPKKKIWILATGAADGDRVFTVHDDEDSLVNAYATIPEGEPRKVYQAVEVVVELSHRIKVAGATKPGRKPKASDDAKESKSGK